MPSLVAVVPQELEKGRVTTVASLIDCVGDTKAASGVGGGAQVFQSSCPVTPLSLLPP